MSKLKIAIAQISPVWLDKEKTIEKIVHAISNAASRGAELVTFGEALLPGYPFWVERTDGARFNSTIQKEMHAHYMRAAIQIESEDLNPIKSAAKQHQIHVVLGTIERPADRGGHSLYCSLVYIDNHGAVRNVHRKLIPTYEERLTWSPGDGHGLNTYSIGPFTMGALNCWENWMPLARTALYAQGENLHISIWPGGDHNTKDLPLFIAKESRSYVVATCGLMTTKDFPKDTPHLDKILDGNTNEMISNGGSCLAGPNGEWIIPPIIGKETIEVAEIDLNRVYEERQNFDPSGHYSRPDVTKLTVNKDRQSIV